MNRENRKKTAISRSTLSRPVRIAFELGLLSSSCSFFDYGCGRGDDLRVLDALEVDASGWDPAHRPNADKRPAEVVNLGYVINVIEDPAERTRVLKDAWGLAQRLLIVAARLSFEQSCGQFRDFGDGCVSAKGTFQKFYSQDELKTWVQMTLGVEPVAAAPGVFFVFRDSEWGQRFLSARWRRRIAIPTAQLSDKVFAANQELLQPLMAFFVDRGRLPDVTELAQAPALIQAFGSIEKAFGLVARVTGPGAWDAIQKERRDDLLVYLALGRFAGRPKFSLLPPDLQWDVRAFFGSYREACMLADKLLFAAGNLEYVGKAIEQSSVGKKTQEALYVHASAMERLAPLLRVYEGCARAFVGRVDDVDIVKLARDKAKVSYMSYPEFDTDPHPALHRTLVVSLSKLRIRVIDYRESENPPILHRKEEFVPADHPLREKFARLTRQEERWGLFDEPLGIGTQQAWQVLLDAKSVRLSGHRLIRSQTALPQAEPQNRGSKIPLDPNI